MKIKHLKIQFLQSLKVEDLPFNPQAGRWLISGTWLGDSVHGVETAWVLRPSYERHGSLQLHRRLVDNQSWELGAE
jgi:hypothetical protein